MSKHLNNARWTLRVRNELLATAQAGGWGAHSAAIATVLTHIPR